MNSSTQLKAHISNLSKKYNLNPQVLLTRFFMDCFLERIALSKYKNNFVLKGGVLISAMVGVDSRMTKDMDITVQRLPLEVAFIKNAIEEIAKMDLNDLVKFHLASITSIRQDFDYNGFTIKLDVEFDKTRNRIQVDITTGDKITPKEIEYGYKLLLEKRTINIASYPIETILAEKIESILARSIANTRMKDYYDCYTLSKMYASAINYETLNTAIKATAKVRHTESIFSNMLRTITLIKTDQSVEFLWLAYSQQFSYAKDISFAQIMQELQALLKKVKLI